MVTMDYRLLTITFLRRVLFAAPSLGEIDRFGGAWNRVCLNRLTGLFDRQTPASLSLVQQTGGSVGARPEPRDGSSRIHIVFAAFQLTAGTRGVPHNLGLARIAVKHERQLDLRLHGDVARWQLPRGDTESYSHAQSRYETAVGNDER